MAIENTYEFCEAVCDFNDMMVHDRNMMHDRAERMGDSKAVAKMMLLNNLLEEHEDIWQYAREYIEAENMINHHFG